MTVFLVLLGAYGLASVPFGLVITRVMGLGDLRQIGSGNIGATNVLRTGNKLAAALTLILDVGKGAIAVLITARLTGDATLIALAAVMGVVGHCYPVWLKFKGGKGVATGIGVVVAVNPLAGLTMIGVWLATAATTRISSAAAMVAYAASPVAVYFLSAPADQSAFASAALAIAVVSIWRHRENIQRLMAGTEPRIGR